MISNEEMSHLQLSCNVKNDFSPNLKASNQSVFHAVYIPRDTGDVGENDVKDILLIFTDKKEALKTIKENKLGRLKSFNTREEAEEFSRTGFESIYNENRKQSTLFVEEKSSNFKSPKPQELVYFRKFIESGNIKDVKRIIWSNPKYLISSGDTPAILQEGCRYNALHVAVKSCQPEMCELILNTINNSEFIKLYYGEEECYLDRKEILMDLYLNTPDKVLNETPLHFAVKFGQKECVQILISYPKCMKTVRNKYDQLPIDVICMRKGQEDEQLKKEIRLLLSNHYYVPVLRSEDNTLQPVIGQPFSPTELPSLSTDPISPRMEMKAFAGPMTMTQALEFRKKWKTPPRLPVTPVKRDSFNDSFNMRSPAALNLSLRLQDTEKGLECVGRNLAEECHVSWKEYWPFLKDFADFRNASGLLKLEKYLEKKYKESLYTLKMQKSENNITNKINVSTINEMNDFCDHFKSMRLNCLNSKTENNSYTSLNLQSNNEYIDSDSDEFYTPPTTPELVLSDSEDEMSLAEEGCAIFIEGTIPTSTDYAAFNALSDSIDPSVYPNIYRWRHEVRLIIKQDPDCFRHKNLKNTKKKLFAEN